MKKKLKKSAPEKKLVLRILPEEFILTTSFYVEQFHTHTSAIRWKLPKKIDPLNINADLEILSDNLQRLTKQYKLEGSQVTIVIPNGLSPLKVIGIPLNLNTSADKKEYAAMQKQAYEFWKEYDETLVDIKDAEIRANFLALNDNDGTSNMLYTACSSKIIKEYSSVILGGNLYPVAFIPEDQSIIRVIESRLTRIERERPFCIFNLTKASNRLIYVSNEVIYVAKVDISDIDEILFDEIPEDDEVENEFWLELTNRLSGNLKQAFAFLKDELKASKVETVFFVSDHSKENILFELFRKNFRLANFRSLSSQFTFNMVPEPYDDAFDKSKDDKEVLEDKIHGSFMLSNLGCYTMHYFSTPSYKNMVIETPLFNLHPNHNFIVNNFKFYNYLQISRKLIIILIVLIISAIGYMGVMNKSDIKMKAVTELKGMVKELEKVQADNAADKFSKEQNVVDFKRLDNLKKGNYNEKLFNFINTELPADLELERVAVRRSSFILLGNAMSVSEANRFYEKLLSNTNFKDLTFRVFKRTDSNLNYFEIKGNTL